MKRIAIAILYFAILCSKKIIAQPHLPSYTEVAKEFFINYSHERKDSNDRVFFVKKKPGWYVRIADQYTDSVKNEQLFWAIQDNKYKPLNGFGPGISREEAAKKIKEGLQDSYGPFIYGFERCRYFGYNEWDNDMIKDFGGAIPENDTLLEGLARAYSSYADRYLMYQTGGYPFDNDSLKTKLAKGKIPGKERVAQFLACTNKAIDCYRRLGERNPGYRLLVGTPEMKLINEQFYQYQELRTYGYLEEAGRVMAAIKSNVIYSQIGHMYLDACPANSILISYGDNDTYPLWYVQAKEGYRKDVTVLNFQLLSTVQYLDMLKRNKEVVFSTDLSILKKINSDYFYFRDEAGQPAQLSAALAAFIEDIQKVKYPFPRQNDTIASYRTKEVIADINLALLKKICNQSNLVPLMSFELSDYMLLNDFILLDLLNMNLYTRPICVTTRMNLFSEKYMECEGSVYRILPLDENATAEKARIEILKISSFLAKHEKPVIVSYGDKQSPGYEDVLHGLHSTLFAVLISDYISLENLAKAKEWAGRYLANPDLKKLSPVIADLDVFESLIKAGYVDEGRLRIEEMAKKLSYPSRDYSAMSFFHSKEDLLDTLEYLEYILDRNKASTGTIEKIMDDIRKED
ncbi:MAG: hypothetical protein Q8941_11350 [Bacteroidota bacterium]|nr:hypothetical protein [Bacteroidota bacterium]